ncbi:MAG TPA: serine kinase, partial [Pseudolabrys sp.]
MAVGASTIHASAVLVGPKAALIRGPAGSGKSTLAWSLVT